MITATAILQPDALSGKTLFWKSNSSLATCTSIQDGTIKTSGGETVVLGYDQWGYNYQAHMFNGFYCDSYKDAEWCQPYKDVKLAMKWNDAWLSNKDCNEDTLLDRHFDSNSYVGSGAWLTNHQSGLYENDGESCSWNYFVKISAPPSDATQSGGMWYGTNGKEIGEVIWGEFAITESIYNDSCAGAHGAEYISPSGPGFGKF